MKEETRKGLSPFEAKVLSDLVAEGKTVFTTKELAEKTKSKIKARKIAYSLLKKNWLAPVNKGVYLVLELAAGSKPNWTEDSWYIASKFAKQYYIGFYNALNYYEWTEQIPLTINVATTSKIKNKKLFEVDYKFVTLTPKKIFGYSEIYVRGHNINLSDREKTIVDALDHPEYCGGALEVAKALYNAQKEVDWNKLIKYAERMENGAIFKRLGYIAELMEIELPDDVKKALKKNITTGYAPLFPNTNPLGKHVSKWNIVVNTRISKELVLA